ncbi:MAG: serine hydrolase domain-containing protein [Bacteroidota bacterium]
MKMKETIWIPVLTTGLLLSALPGSALKLFSTPVIPEGIQQVKDYLAKQTQEGRFSGTILVARDGKPLLFESAGLANKRFNAPNKLDTKFNLGSLNKSFTAVAILQLVAAGKIGIDDPIGKYLDMFPKAVADKVTVRQLLNMSNGWGDYWQNAYYLAHINEMRSVSDHIEFIKDMPLDFEPGSKTQHSNTGFEVAGAIIEKVTGMDYFDYIREKIYKPAGMTNTDTYNRDAPVENMATGYTNMHPLDNNQTGWQWENTYILAPRGTPAGGGYSTAEDMLKYDNAIRAATLIGKKYVDFMSNGYRGNIGDPFVPSRVSRGAGGAPGISSFFGRDWKNGYTIIVLFNVDNPVGIEIGDEIIKILKLE